MSAPRGHWLLGHIPALRRDPLGLLDQCHDAVTPLHLGKTAWLLLDPPDIAHVLNDRRGIYTKGAAFRYGRLLYGNSLLVSEGDEHRQQGRLIGGLFFRHAAKHFIEPAHEIASRLADRWQHGQRIDLWAAMLDLTLALSSRAIFGNDWLPSWLPDGSPRAEAILAAFDAAMGHVARQNFSLLPLPDWLPVPPVRRYRAAIRLLNDAVGESVMHRRNGTRQGGFLDTLLSAKDDNGVSLPMSQVRDQALILMLGGYESTATALCWTLLLLARHDEVRQRLLADNEQLTYSGQVFSESLRLYPPPWLMPRTTSQPDTLPSGFTLPRGAQVFLSPYRTQHDKRYFLEPMRFDPTRFESSETWPVGAYFPFGTGPRHCIGESIARTQVPRILQALCRRWRFVHDGNQLPAPKPLLTLRPPIPLWVTVERETTVK